MSKHKTIEWDVTPLTYANQDDVLGYAASIAAEMFGIAPDYDMAPRWADDERETVLLDVPADTQTDD